MHENGLVYPGARVHEGRDTGSDFFIPQFSDSSVTFPGTQKRNKNVSFRFFGIPLKSKIYIAAMAAVDEVPEEMSRGRQGHSGLPPAPPG